jgi:hypothetical protein
LTRLSYQRCGWTEQLAKGIVCICRDALICR